jgi:acyl carrier protein
VAAFSMSDRGVERLVLVAEIEREHFRSINADEVIHAIRHQIALDHEASVDQVVLLKPYKIPVTSSGKIQRRQTRQMLVDNELDTIADSGITQTRHYVDPVTDTEKLLVAIWCEVLKLDRLGVDDDFFEIGGDSIAGLEIGAAIQKQLAGVEFDVAQLQEFPTVARLAQLLDLKIAHAKNKQLAKTQSGNKVISI